MHSLERSDLEREERGEEELQIIMAERVEAEILHMKEKREAYSAAVGWLWKREVRDRHM